MPNEGDVIKIVGISGKTYEFVWKSDPPAGGMKTVYFSPDKSYVVAIYHKEQSRLSVARLKEIIAGYRKIIFDGPGKDYWEKVFCWPTDVIDDGKVVGLVMPTYPSKYFFQFDGRPMGANGRVQKLKGQEKNGIWYVNPFNRFGRVNESEIGDWHNYFGICLMLARGVRRLHFAGLAHSDLSHNNVLCDPATSSAVIIDIDGLVVPDKYPSDVYGTKSYIAPEVMETIALPFGDPMKKMPRQETDLHSLAVLIYKYLLCRDPVMGNAFYTDVPPEPDIQENLMFGSRATFIEHPTDMSNHYGKEWVSKNCKAKELPYMFPWLDLDALPYTILGPHLKRLFDKAFVDGLHNPSRRPRANEWESALAKTYDMLMQCQNPACTQKWFVYDEAKKRQVCPFCGHEHKTEFPVLHLHRMFKGTWISDKTCIVGFHGQRIRTWHSRIGVAWSEQNTPEEKQPLAALVYHQGQWLLMNQRSEGMMLLEGNKTIPVGGNVVLKDGMEIRLEKDGSRMVKIEMVNQ